MINNYLMRFAMRFQNSAQKKRELALVSRKAERLGDSLRETILDLRNNCSDNAKIERYNELYYAVPSYLSNWTKKKEKMFSEFSEFSDYVEAMHSLKAEYTAIKNAEIGVDNSVSVEDEIKAELKTILDEQKEKCIEGKDFSDKFSGMKVTVNAHYVYRNGKSFIRCFWYLNDTVTALDKIIKIAEKIKREKS
jgi:hypothetical protein